MQIASVNLAKTFKAIVKKCNADWNLIERISPEQFRGDREATFVFEQNIK